MIMAYLKSNSVRAFPATRRSSDYPEGFLTTEKNLTDLARLICGNEATFILENTFEATPLSPIHICIHGYLFELSDVSSLPKDGDLFVTAYIKNNVENGDYGQLISVDDATTHTLDSDTEFKGLTFTTTKETIPTAPTGATAYTLQLLSKGKIPGTSLLNTLSDFELVLSTQPIYHLPGDASSGIPDRAAGTCLKISRKLINSHKQITEIK